MRDQTNRTYGPIRKDDLMPRYASRPCLSHVVLPFMYANAKLLDHRSCVSSLILLTDDGAVCIDQESVLLSVAVHVHTVRRVNVTQHRPETKNESVAAPNDAMFYETEDVLCTSTAKTWQSLLV